MEGKLTGRRRILILSSDTGGGHRSASEAITQALERLNGHEVETIDALAQGSFPVSRSPYLYALMTLYAPTLWAWAFHLTNAPLRAQILAFLLNFFIRKKLEKLLTAKKPDVVVSVHPLVNHAISEALRRLGNNIPFIIVGTELINIHRAWACPKAYCHIMPTQQAKEAILSYGIPKDKVKFIGPPVKPAFSEEKRESGELRKILGLNPSLPTVLLVSGGEGTGRVYDFALALSQSRIEMQLLIVTGRNRKLKARLGEIHFKIPTHIYGFVENMPMLMHASDLIITRAGSITVSEALVCGLPIIFTGALPGQEEGNIEWVVGEGAGRVATTPSHLVVMLRELLSDRSIMIGMAEKASRLVNPRSIWEIAEFIVTAPETFYQSGR